jgi:hypothetical protein
MQELRKYIYKSENISCEKTYPIKQTPTQSHAHQSYIILYPHLEIVIFFKTSRRLAPLVIYICLAGHM